MKILLDWGGFSSTALIPTLMVGRGWVYAYWLQGRIGIRWK